MKVQSIINIALSAVIFSSSPAAMAASVSFTPSTGNNAAALAGSIKLEKLGKVAIPRGRMTFHGSEVLVTTIPEWQFDRVEVLTGTLLKATSIGNGQSATVNGIVYFQDGDWLGYIDNPNGQDSIVTTTGTLSGKLAIGPDGSITIKQKDGTVTPVSADTIQELYSSRAYNFSIPATANAAVTAGQAFEGEASSLTLKPSEKIFRLSALKKDPSLQDDGDVSTKKLILIGTVLTGLQTAQFIPILCTALRQGHMERMANKEIFQTLTQPAVTPTNVMPLGY
jgi:hypothetical protein